MTLSIVETVFLPQSSALATFLNPADQEAKSLGEKFSQVL